MSESEFKTAEQVHSRRREFLDTLTYYELCREEDLSYSITEKCDGTDARRNVVKFLKDHNVNIVMQKKPDSIEEILGLNAQLQYDLSERTYRFADKIFKLNHRDRNPLPVLDSALDLLGPVTDNGEIMDFMDIISESMTLSREMTSPEDDIMAAVMLNFFPEIVDSYNSALQKIERRKAQKTEEKLQLIESYTTDLNTYLAQLKETIWEHSVQKLDGTSRKKLLTKIRELQEGKFEFNHNSQIISPIYIAQLARSKDGISDFEERYGVVVAVDYSRNIGRPSRDVIVYTDRREPRFVITFPKESDSHVTEFCLSLTQQASRHGFGNNTAYKVMTNKAITCFQKGHLNDR